MRVETPRLTGRPLRPEDYPELRRLRQDPRVARTLGGVLPDGRVKALLAADLRHWERRGFGPWALRERGTGRFVGRGGLRTYRLDGRDEVEIGYALRPAFWGRGLATEIARASAAAGLGELGLPSVIAFTLPHNRASRKVMEKAGLSYERTFVHAGLPHALYRIRGPRASRR